MIKSFAEKGSVVHHFQVKLREADKLMNNILRKQEEFRRKWHTTPEIIFMGPKEYLKAVAYFSKQGQYVLSGVVWPETIAGMKIVVSDKRGFSFGMGTHTLMWARRFSETK